MKRLRQLILILCGWLVLQPCFVMGIQAQIPGEPAAPQTSDFRHLSNEEAINEAVKWAKYGKQPDTNTVVDTAISVISIGYPPAGVVLGIIKGLVLTGGSDPVGEALKAINNHLAEIDQRLDSLEKEIKAVRIQQFQDENLARIRTLRGYGKHVQDGNDQLRLLPTSNFDKQTIANQARTTADLFLNDPDLWKWSDLHVFTDKTTGQLTSGGLLPPDFEPLPTFEYYASSLVLWMAAIEYASGGDPKYVTDNKPLVNALLKHAAYLSVRPTWHELETQNTPDPPQTLPENIMRRVNSYVQPVSTYPTNRMCNASRFVEDVFRRTKTLIDTAQVSMPSDNTLCTLSMPKPKEMPADANRNDVYGSEAMALWQRWRTPPVLAQEDELEQSYGIEAMTLLADKLVRLAKFGTTREQFIGIFDPTTSSQQFLYAVKPNGELLWYRHLLTTKTQGAAGSSSNGARTTLGNSSQERQGSSSQSGNNNTKLTTTLGNSSQRRQGSVSKSGNAEKESSATAAGQSARRNPGSAQRRPHAKSPVVKHFLEGPKLVRSGWQQFREVFPAGLNGIYAVTQDGILKWYSHDGFADGSDQWKPAVDVGTGWQSFARIVPGGDGVVYGITPEGLLKWYKHGGYVDGSGISSWSGPVGVGPYTRTTRPRPAAAVDWSKFKHVFSGGEGIIYAVTPDGILKWYRHTGYMTGTAEWEGPKDVGTGWQDFKKIFSPGDGNIYALTSSGDLLWYKHNGYKDGIVDWENPVEVASGWGDFLFVFPRMWGTDSAGRALIAGLTGAESRKQEADCENEL